MSTEYGVIHSGIFQQDGAPPHFSRTVTEFLKQHFPDRVIGRGFEISWPPRSPDLTPLDYWFWSLIKSRVYHNHKPSNIEDLRSRIEYEISQVTQEEVQEAVKHLLRRMHFIVEEDGGIIEHLL